MEPIKLNLRLLASFGRSNYSKVSRSLSISRRTFLKCFSLVAINTSPAVGGLTSTLSQASIKIVTSRNKIIFKLGNHTAWVVDINHFGGKPRLRLIKTKDYIEFELIGALLPGTDISADFVCKLKRELFDWRLKLSLKVLPFRADVPLTEWLNGTRQAICSLSTSGMIGTIGKGLNVSITDDSYLKFSPNWQLEIISNGKIVVGCKKWSVVSGYANLIVPGKDEPSVFNNLPPKRTILVLEREGRQWQLSSLFPSYPLSIFHNSAESFDTLAIEAGEHNSIDFSAAVIAWTNKDESTVSFLPGKSLTGADGKRFKIPLQNISLATTVDEQKPESLIHAYFGRSPSSFNHNGYIIEVGQSEGVPPFELIVHNNEIVYQRCEPALLRVFTMMSDAITGPMLFPDGPRLSFNNGEIQVFGNRIAEKIIGISKRSDKNPLAARPDIEKNLALTADFHSEQIDPSFFIAASPPITKPINKQINRPTVRNERPVTRRQSPASNKTKVKGPVDPQPAEPSQRKITRTVRPATINLPDLTVPVLRPEDFLSLTFHFYNLRLESGGGSRLVRKNNAAQSYITVQFPPQSIQEEALFEEETARDPAKALPIQSRISGQSRLVFQVPKEVQSIPYTLKDLLDACGKYPMRVSATAVPPLPQEDDDLSIRSIKGRANNSKGSAAFHAVATKSVVPNSIKTDLRLNKQNLRIGGPEKGKPPGSLETAIEMPYRLWLSPHRGAAWAHSLKPAIGHRNRIELWHTRLAVRGTKGIIDENNDYYRTLRAIWSPDYDQKNVPAAGSKSFLTSLDALDRHEIVALTSDFRIPEYTPLPIWAEQMFLTSYGAWLNSRGNWEPPCDPNARQTEKPSRRKITKLFVSPTDTCPTKTKGTCDQGVWLNVEEWRHRATMGRDHYVRVVYKGYLFPFGHRASLIKVTERKFRVVEEGPLKGKVAAYLHQRIFIVVRQPVLHYPVLGGKDRLNPFRKITITTLTTPNLDKASKTQINNSDRQAFWVFVSGKPFIFSMVGEDWSGSRSDFAAPVIFLDQSKAKNKTFVTQVINDEYGPEINLERRKREWSGQSVAFAEITNANRLATTLDTHTFTFSAGQFDCGDAPGDRPLFFPIMEQAQVRIPAVEALSGGKPTKIAISKLYEEHGFGGKNAQGEIYAKVVDASPLIFDADQSGGLATPNINIAGLSRKMGPVGGEVAKQGDDPSILANFANGTFDPEEYFKGAAAEAMILGGIKLFELFGTDMSSKHAPKLENKPIYKGDDLQAIETKMIWAPPLKPRIKTFNDLKGKAKFKLEVLIINSLDGSPPESSMRGILTDFSIDLLADLGEAATFIIIEFASFEFISISGSKTEVNPVIRDVRFAGALKYVNELSKFLSSGGINIDLTPSGVTASFSLAIPVINTGVMALQNISINAGISIPFSGDPMRLRFAFCERNNPFLLTIYCFGGGGYVSLALGLDGVEQLEMAFEFGASCALDIGVASGGVEVMAGVYILVDDDGCCLTGYLRMSGELCVLAIIRLSIEFYMSLSHDTKTNKTWGECSLTVEIEILFFSASVSMHVRREFSEPTYLPFREMMTQDSWTDYCEAFA